MGILKNPIQSIRAAMGDLSALVRDRQVKRETILARIFELESLPLPKKDVIAALNAVVDAGAADFRERLQVQLSAFLKHGRGIEGLPGNFPVLCPNSGQSWTGVHGSAIYGLFGPMIREALAKIVDGLDLGEAGPPVAERMAEIEKLNRQLTEIEGELADLQAAAESAGVQLTGYRPTGKKA